VDSRVKYGILIVVGGVGVYLIWKGGYLAQWMPSVFGPGAPLGSAVIPAAPAGATPAQIAAAQPSSAQPTTLPTGTPSVPAVPAPTPTPVSVAPAPTPTPITPAAATQLVSQKMVTAAGMSDGLSMDEWCFYFTQVTGSDCPIDPGSIDPQVYHDAGVLQPDGTTPGDRSTPTSIQTWLAIMQNQAPSACLSGLAGLAALRVANAWLV
jgi:hypothetical protein